MLLGAFRGGNPLERIVAKSWKWLSSDYYREVLGLYLERPLYQEAVAWECSEGRFGYSDLKETAFVRGGRYGISIDFGLEVVERRSTCGETFKSKFIDPTMKP